MVLPEKLPTCTESGLTEGKKCSVCGEILVKQETIEARHAEEIMQAIEPTCTESGLTEGKKCSVCDKIWVEQKIINAKGHIYGSSYTCKVCNFVSAVESTGLEFELNTETDTYTVIGIGTCTDADIVIPYIYEGKLVTSIGSDVFYNCTSLTSITIPDSVTSIGVGAFYGCTSLTNVTIGNGVTSIGSDAFYFCTSLTNLTIPDSVTSIGYRAFYACTSLSNINVDKNNPNYKSIDGNLYTKDGKNLIQYSIGKQDISFVIPSSVTSIESCAFRGCTSLTSITIPSSVTSIGDFAFMSCTSLTSITIPSSVTSIGGGAFV